MPNCNFDVDDEQDYEEEDATRVRVSKRKQLPKYIAPMSMNTYANLAKQRVVAPNVSGVLKRQVIDTRRAINSRLQEFEEVHKRNGQLPDTNHAEQNKSRERVTKGKSSVARRQLFAIDNDDVHGESDMRFHEQDGADDIEDEDIGDIDVNEAYEEQDGSEDDGDEDKDQSVNDLENENDSANENALENENDELIQEEHEVPQPENEAVGNVRKRVRGPTRMPKIWAQEKEDRIPILVNERGQPINDNSSRLTHFMGTLSRSGKFCPIHKPWNKVADAKKQTLLDFLKTKFDIPECAETWILRSFGMKVKNWRARVKENYHDPSLSIQEQINSRPKQVQKKQWRRLVKYWNKEKSMRVSEKNKANRAKKKMVQLTGKKSYARVREELKVSLGQDPSRLEMFRTCFSKDGTTKNMEAANAIAQMQELSSKLPEGSIDKPGPDDVFSKVMGKDRNGDANMYGLGVRASDVWGVIPSRSACRRENIQLKSRCKELSGRVEQLTAQVSEMNGPRDGSSVPSLTSTHCAVVANVPQRLRVGDEVFLRSIINSTDTVARGRVKSLDPNEQIAGKEIGRDWCEVNVQVAIKRDENLVRPYGIFVTIEDAIGASIAWPCPFISVVRED